MTLDTEQPTVTEDLAERLAKELASALKRKPSDESLLAGATRVLAPRLPAVRAAMLEALEVLTKRGSVERPLYRALVRGLAEAGELGAAPLITLALSREDVGGLPTIAAAACLEAPELSEPLARIVTRGQAHLAFAAEMARVARGQSNGLHLAGIAPKIKEAHRLDLCSELVVPLLHCERTLPPAIEPAMAVLRSAERHLGRWLVMAEIAVRAGSDAPWLEARQQAQSGPESARAAWQLLAWALDRSGDPPPTVRPTVELVARLSDRPSAERDMTFLFRMAERGLVSTRPMLESLVKSPSEGGESVALRACAWLARSHGREELFDRLADAARAPRKDAVKGLAVAALFDAGQRDRARTLARGLLSARSVANAAWAWLVLACQDEGLVVRESTFRRLQLGSSD